MPGTKPTLRAKFSVKIGGQDKTEEMESDVDEIIVDSSLHLPDMFTIRLQAPRLRWIDDTSIDFGKEVEISAQAAVSRGGHKGPLIKAEITSLEPEFSAQGNHTFLIRGYDKSNRLHLGKHSRTFTNQTDKQIVETIANEVGLTPDVDLTTGAYEYVILNNQTYMEFLAERAQRIGYQVYAIDGKLSFKKGDASHGNIPVLEIGNQLLYFRPRMTAARQANKVRVVGWDVKGKVRIEGTAEPPSALNQGGMSKTGGAVVRSAFQEAEMMVVDYPVSTVDEAKALAQGLANDIGADFVEAEGVCFGDPRIKAGMKVELKGLGKRFSGKYFVTSATHIYSSARDYETHFTVTGRQPHTISHLLEHTNGNGNGYRPGRVNGVVVGLVISLNDELNLGRVQVKYPWLLGKNNGEIASAWAKVAAPMAGQDTKGVYFLPEVNDEVLIAFEHGDMNRPYIIGVLWNNKDKPPKPNNQVVKEGKVVQRIIRSRLGHEIVLDDSTDKPSILIVDKTKENSIFIDSAKNDMAIKVKGNLTIDVGGNITITARGNISVDATGKFDAQAKQAASVITSTELKLEGKARASMKSPNIEVNSNVGTIIKSSGFAKVESAGVTIIQGSLVKIN